jgi:hypothetical protein
MSPKQKQQSVFVGPQIKQLIADNAFWVYSLKYSERSIQNDFTTATQNIPGTHRSPRYSEFVDKLLKANKELGISISAVGNQTGLCFQIKRVAEHMRKARE